MSHHKQICTGCGTVMSMCKCMDCDRKLTYGVCIKCMDKPVKKIIPKGCQVIDERGLIVNMDKLEDVKDTPRIPVNRDRTHSEVLEQNGWTIDCISPLEVSQEETGDRATGSAAVLLAEYYRIERAFV